MAKHAAPELAPKKKPKKGKRRFRWLVIPLVTLMILTGVLTICVGVFLWKFDYEYDEEFTQKTDEELGITNTTLTKEVINIALFGVDSRNATSFSGNTDSIMVISIDQIHNKIKLTSIMRDTLVYMPEFGYRKINSVYRKGGPELAIKTINTMYNMNIRHYATVNFTGMRDIIDAVGGIEVDVTESERWDANNSIRSMSKEVGTAPDYIQKAGLQTLNGVQAVCWARIRHVSTADGVSDDFGRTDRQRFVMEQLFQKVTSMSATQLPGLADTLLDYVKTSLSYGDILDMAGILMDSPTFEQTRIPQKEYIINADYRAKTGSSTVYYNLEYAGKVWQAFVYDDMMPAEYMEKNGVSKIPWAG